jgi:hypothetical protein
MPDVVQVHAFLPRPLKCRAFSIFALQEQTFSHWLRETLEMWLHEVEQSGDKPQERANGQGDMALLVDVLTHKSRIDK